MGLLFDELNQIITVESPAVEITMQDLIDGVRDYEDNVEGMDIPKIADASGKEALGGGVLVGITVTLIDWKLKFEDRAGPDTIICNATGGNLVTYDTGTSSYINPIEPATYVTVVITASSSATLQELGAIQYSSFGGGITVDITSSYTGTEFPVGTPQAPVNNLSDAMDIANERGFTTLFIIGNITIDTSGNYDGMVFIGESQTKTIMTISDGASVVGCEFRDAEIVGVVDGNSLIQNCIISDLDYVYGILVECILEPGTITLDGANPAHFLDCWSGNPGVNWPTIDCGGSGQALVLQNFNGRMKITNKTGTDELSVALNAGEIWIDSTVTDGNVEIRGIGDLIDDSTGSAVVDSSALISSYLISTTTWDSVYVDVNVGESGTDYPLGTARTPVDNISDAITICNRENIESLHLHGNITLPSSGTFGGFTFVSHSPDACILNLNTADIESAAFFHLTMSGIMNGEVHAHQCKILSTANLHGEFVNCTLADSITIATGELSAFFGGQSLLEPITIDMNGNSELAMSKYIAEVTVTNMTDADSMFSYQGAGAVTIDSSCTDGTARVAGELRLVDNSSGTTVQDGSIRASVWDVPIANHQTAGTFGVFIQYIMGLVGENTKWSAISHDANNNMTAATITQYTDNTLVTPLKVWSFTATYNASSEMTAHQLVEV